MGAGINCRKELSNRRNFAVCNIMPCYAINSSSYSTKDSRSLLDHLQQLFLVVGFPLPHTKAFYSWEHEQKRRQPDDLVSLCKYFRVH
jgi:hypothetical protein